MNAETYVTDHAVIRYFERVLEYSPGAAVKALKDASNAALAFAWCTDFGMTIDAVKAKIADAVVVAAIHAGAVRIKRDGYELVVQRSKIVTIVPVSRCKARILTPTEARGSRPRRSKARYETKKKRRDAKKFVR